MSSKPPSPTERFDRTWPWLAFAWGLAEATFFFIVPDVFTSRLVLQQPRRGFVACLPCLAGALCGGVLLYFLGQNAESSAAILAALDRVPGIKPDLIEGAALNLERHRLTALFLGALTGIPFKLYAVQAASAGFGFASFLFASALARLSRFLLVTGLVWFVGSRLLPNLSADAKLRVHAGGWLLFYCFYFWRIGL